MREISIEIKYNYSTFGCVVIHNQGYEKFLKECGNFEELRFLNIDNISIKSLMGIRKNDDMLKKVYSTLNEIYFFCDNKSYEEIEIYDRVFGIEFFDNEEEIRKQVEKIKAINYICGSWSDLIMTNDEYKVQWIKFITEEISKCDTLQPKKTTLNFIDWWDLGRKFIKEFLSNKYFEYNYKIYSKWSS